VKRRRGSKSDETEGKEEKACGKVKKIAEQAEQKSESPQCVSSIGKNESVL
jgi:hypothetical protein